MRATESSSSLPRSAPHDVVILAQPESQYWSFRLPPSLREIGFPFTLALLLLLPAVAAASGPRFVTGPPFFTGQQGLAIGWKQSTLLYSTDPGALSASVNHAAADALVASAVSVWNLPIASITVAQGGALAEHVSAQNTYLDTSGMVFPADVMSTNAASVPIAVIYDNDGSITDLLLGSGASEPSSCRQNGVTETVDSFDPAGYILHGILVLNGRCTGAAPALQLELQYQLMRAFGRVLGLAWSQTNDNVFTGTPTPTYAQAMNWPIMHPLDIICGPYTYQCLPFPFQLRPDDIASMVAVYPIAQNATLTAGKQPSLADAHAVLGHVYFPTGEGMAGVNVLVRREPGGSTLFDTWYEASAVSGANFRSTNTSPFVAADTSAWGSFGSHDINGMGSYFIAYVPIFANVPWQNVAVSIEPVNPLYSGAHSLGPYAPGDVAPSGSIPAAQISYVNGAFGEAYVDFNVSDAAPACGNGEDGTASAPIQAPSTGWWNGLLCGYGHASYIASNVQPGRSFTIEVTALDASGSATETKAMPVIGLFAPTDSPGSLPSLGFTPAAFQGNAIGTTTLSAETGQLTSFWFGIADQRGDGRPDYNYQARLFYADNVVPAQIAATGGTITIAGLGFRAGNAVKINGIAATVLRWTANSIVLTAPPMAAVNASNGVAVDIVVSDLSTGATSTMSSALTYTSVPTLPNILRLVSAPASSVYVGDLASVAFAVQVLAPDGVTPVAGQSIVFTASPVGAAVFAACAAATTCILITDANGMASTGVTPEAAGTLTLQAAEGAVTQTAAFPALAQAGSLQVWIYPSGSMPVGIVAPTPIGIHDFAPGYAPLPGRLVTFSAITGSATFSACSTSPCAVTTDYSGSFVLTVTPTSVGLITIQVADGDVKQTFSFTSISSTDTLTTTLAPAPQSYVDNAAGAFAVTLLQGDGITPDRYQTVTFTGSTGVVLLPCGTAACTVVTGWSGAAQVGVGAAQPGTYTVQAVFGSLTQTITFTILAHTQQLVVVSAPSGLVLAGTTPATPFTVQLLEDGVTPIPNAQVSISGIPGATLLANCGYQRSDCRLTTDVNGMVSSPIQVFEPGIITLSANYVQSTVSTTFTATGVGDAMTVIQQPGAAGVFVGDTVNLSVQVMAAGGLTPLVGHLVQFQIAAGPFTYTDTSINPVNHGTDGNGMASEVGIASAPGTITVIASDGFISQTMTFVATARPDVLKLVSAPASGGYAGTVASVPFAVQLFASDGVTPLPNRSVTLSVTNGSASFTGCGTASTCALQTDSTGTLTAAVTPLSVGSITLLAAEGGAQQATTFTTIASPLADLFSLTAIPGTSVYVGAIAASPISVLVTLADGVTPVAGIPITFASSPQSAGAVQFGPCSTASCTVLTNASGTASTRVTGVTAGAVTLVATSALSTGPQTVSTPLQVVANQLSVTAQNPIVYVQQGATLPLALTSVAIENASPAAAQAMQWTAGTGFLAAATSTVTNSSGTSSLQVVLGPLAAGVAANASACAWTTVCAAFEAVGVAASSEAITIISGSAQSLTSSAQYLPIVVQVVDSAGHPVAAAPVSIYQTITALAAPCPRAGTLPRRSHPGVAGDGRRLRPRRHRHRPAPHQRRLQPNRNRFLSSEPRASPQSSSPRSAKSISKIQFARYAFLSLHLEAKTRRLRKRDNLL